MDESGGAVSARQSVEQDRNEQDKAVWACFALVLNDTKFDGLRLGACLG